MKPIIFTGPSLPAIDSGLKRQTRRLLDPQPVQRDGAWYWKGGRALLRAGYGADYVHGDWYSVERAIRKVSTWQEGQRRWVREAWATQRRFDRLPPAQLRPSNPRDPGSARVHYVADGPLPPWAGRVRSPLHMPRWASRWEVTITGIRVQRLQQMSDEDARAEGAAPCPYVDGHPSSDPGGCLCHLLDTPKPHVCTFIEGWGDLHGSTGPASWGADPWVFALTFEAHRTRRAEAA